MAATDPVNFTEEQVEALGGVISGNIGKAKILTTSDYDWPTANPTGIAMWLLEPGIYKTSSQLDFYASGSVGSPIQATLLVVAPSGQSARVVMYAEASSLSAVTSTLWQTLYSSQSSYSAWGKILTENNIATTTGNSSSAVMSQNAVTSMVYADPADKYKVQIGSGANCLGYGVAIGSGATVGSSMSRALSLGSSANATANDSIALGSASYASQKGEMNIGNNQGNGYNNSNYRLLTGLYDGQSAHDAATKGQLDSAVNTLETELDAKQDVLTAGSNVQIVNDTISATDTTYTAGTGLALNGTQFSVDTAAIATQSDLTAGLATKQDTLTAGANIQINNNTISATDTTYTAGTGIDITNNVISATSTGPTVVQTTGTSTTDVMSQKAVTDIVGNIESALNAINNGTGA